MKTTRMAAIRPKMTSSNRRMSRIRRRKMRNWINS